MNKFNDPTFLKALAAKRFQEVFRDRKFCEQQTVLLSAYAMETDFDEVVIKSEPMNFFQNRIYSAMFAELISAAKIKPIFVEIEPEDYFSWLIENKLKNTTENRAAYCGVMISD